MEYQVIDLRKKHHQGINAPDILFFIADEFTDDASFINLPTSFINILLFVGEPFDPLPKNIDGCCYIKEGLVDAFVADFISLADTEPADSPDLLMLKSTLNLTTVAPKFIQYFNYIPKTRNLFLHGAALIKGYDSHDDESNEITTRLQAFFDGDWRLSIAQKAEGERGVACFFV